MIICPFCHFNNEDGSLFCEQCKSDLSGVAPAAAAPAAVEPIPVAPMDVSPVPVMPMMELTPMAVEPMPVEVMPVEVMPVEVMPVEVMPVEPIEVMPVEAAPLEVAPVAVEPIHAAPPTPPPPVAAAPPPPPPPVPVAPPPAPVAAAPAGDGALPPGSKPKLVVIRGQRRDVEYPLFEGLNFIGRADDKPVDIDLEDQEPPDRVWCSRQHAVLHLENNTLMLEDLNSSNGTYLNRTRVNPGKQLPLKPNDVIQIGNVQMKVVV